jgi:hypothetical protein
MVDQDERSGQTRAMGKRAKVALVLIAAVIAAVVMCWPRPQHQPTYQGRPLQHWVALLDAPYKEGTNLITIAKAIDAAGTDALPFLLEWIHYESPPWQRSIVRLLSPVAPPLIVERVARPSRFRLASGSILAFRQLGNTAVPAIPQLARLANSAASRETAWRAIEALAEIGTNSLPVLQQIIEDPRHPMRASAAFALTTMFRHPTAFSEPALPPDEALLHLIRCTTNDQTIFCFAATVLLGERGRHAGAPPPQCVPALTNCLQSTNRMLRIEAMEALGKFGTNATQAIPDLAKIMKGPDTQLAARAFAALRQITPGTYTNYATRSR